MYRCFNCGKHTVIWNGDFDFADYGLEGDGIIHDCSCMNCGAKITYECPNEEGEKMFQIPQDQLTEFTGFTVYDAKSGEPAPLEYEELFVLDEDGLLLKIYPSSDKYMYEDVPKEGKYLIQFADGKYMRW